ncbi:MAG TPA: SDR family oxidoreductase [Gemmatimonadaceae bacterium]|nr:SDR family oxidoreductase [Gemmatimonadaceae bacterium]
MLSPHYRRIRERLAANPKRWLITGVAGFIGSNLLDALLGLGQEVVGLDDFSTGYRSNIEEVLGSRPESAERFTLIEGDIRNIRSCEAACDGVDHVLHQAALASVPGSIDDPATAHSVNVDGAFNMLLAARKAGVKRFVYASSSAVYGDATEQPQTESRTGRALSPYAAQKAINETYATAFQMAYGLETVGLRYYNIFGPRQDPDGAYAAVIPRWIANLLRDEPCLIYGDGETTRDFCFVANVVQANLLAATTDTPDATGQAYNIACSRSVTLNQLFALITEQLSSLGETPSLASPVYQPFRAGDIRHSSGSIDRARRLLGYAPTYEVRDGLAEVLPWYLSHSGALVAPSESHAARAARG